MSGATQLRLLGEEIPPWDRTTYRPFLTATVNRKGVLDVDTIKGCTLGMQAYPDGGCYGECYAARTAARYGRDFTKSICRQWTGIDHRSTIIRAMMKYPAQWYRVGTFGDPSYDWTHTIAILRELRWTKKVPVIITKHWRTLSEKHISDLVWLSAVMNTSVSGLDTDEEIAHRVGELDRLRAAGIKSVCRVVTCDYGTSEWSRRCKEKQDYLLSLEPTIDNPLRISTDNPRLLSGEIAAIKRADSIGGGKLVSLHRDSIHLGGCRSCPDQCGADVGPLPDTKEKETSEMELNQPKLFNEVIEFLHVQSVIGSGYEADVSKLAIEDGIAHRAARKNMQIHSAIILLLNGKFSGFMTFQNNHVCKEFCLLQSVIKPELYTDDLYKEMVLKVIEQNTSGYPAIMTTNPKSKFETPKLYESLGFKTYLAMSGFCYMVHGDLSTVRMKLLAHITMTNVWDSVKAEWLKIKKEWNRQIAEAGEKNAIPNPTFATREGCWQGENGFANVVTGHSHNGNASVLDPTACEVILRFFMPKEGTRIYNPFGGGVQFGFVSGIYGYEYVASELRKNQCDANNVLCKEFSGVQWVQSDSATYEPEGMFDLVFTCPPYYRVERYVDYDGKAPEGEINSLSTYDEFREALFSGYRRAIAHLNDNSFFVVMTGDSRNSKGAFHCSESETELFFKESGLSVYNKIVYLEAEFTRLAHAKKTLNMRKFPKREQKIIVAYKGDISKIKDKFSPIGRL